MSDTVHLAHHVYPGGMFNEYSAHALYSVLEHALRFDAGTLPAIIATRVFPLCSRLFTVDTQDDGLTPMEYAAWHGSQQAVVLLATRHECTTCRHAALSRAIQRGHDEITGWMVDHCGASTPLAFQVAVQSGNLGVLRWALGVKHVPVDTILPNGRTALSLAMETKLQAVLAILLSYGASSGVPELLASNKQTTP
jgi:ankyrin repeat protein